MKKLVFLFVIITNLSCSGKSQDSIFFKIQYNPERIYKTLINQSSETKISYAALKNNKPDEPPIPPSNMNLKTLSESTIITGRITDGDDFPFIIKSVTPGDSLNEQMGSETIYYGKCSLDNMITIDSLSSSIEMEEEMKEHMLEWTQNHYSQIKFPGKKVKVGDTILHELPYAIPNSELAYILNTKTIYHLQSFSNDIAIFSLNYTLESFDNEFQINSMARGKGEMHYDVSNHFLIYFQMEIYSEIISEAAGLNMNMMTTSQFTSTTSIKLN